MKVEQYDDLHAVGAAAWEALHQTSRLRAPFLTWSWQEQWARAFGAEQRQEIRCVLDDHGGLVAVLPLIEAAPGVWRLLGGVDVSDYLDLLVTAGREGEAWAALLQSRTADSGVWDLHAVPGASYTVTMLPQVAMRHGLPVASAVEERCPVLALPDSWEGYLAALSGKHRHELRRKIRRLEREVPGMRLASMATPAEIDARLDDFLDLHRRSRTGKGKFMDERMAGFFRGVLAALAERRSVRLTLLDSDEGPLASFVTLEWDDTIGLYNSGFDPARAALSPGLVLLARLIRDAIERGKRRFDFLRGEERYKYEFGPTPEDVYTVRIG